MMTTTIDGEVPFFTVSLDEPLSTRWSKVIAHFQEHLQSVMSIIDHFISQLPGGTTVGSLLDSILASSVVSQRVLYIEEITAIAQQADLPVGKLIAMQLIYEACANCTSMIVPSSFDTIPEETLYRHIRSMDWEMAFLKPLTLEASFVLEGKELFRCTTWAGYVGVLTGLARRDNSFSIAVNFRAIGSGSFFTNLRHALKDSWPIGFLVRAALTEASGYAAAVSWLRGSKLIAPTYFTVCGSEPGQGCLITREREKEDSFLGIGDVYPSTLTSKNHASSPCDADDEERVLEERAASQGILLWSRGPPHLPVVQAIVQTNMDHFEDDESCSILWSLQRRRLAIKSFQNHRSHAAGRKDHPQLPQPVPVERLWRWMSQVPIMNDITVYVTLMMPATGEYETRLPAPSFGVQRQNGKLISSTTHITKGHCCVCHVEVVVDLNCPGKCRHLGTWHGTYADCKFVKCGRGLQVKDWGLAHWSCCFSTDADPNSVCTASGFHVLEES